jgi:hypothetical protein
MPGSPKKRAKRLAQAAEEAKKALPAELTQQLSAGKPGHDPDQIALGAVTLLGPVNRREVPALGSDEARKVVWEMSLAGIARNRIADYLGCTEQQLLYHYAKELDGATDEIVGRVALSLAQKALMGDTQAMVAFLRHRGGEAWREKQTVEHTGKDGAPISVDMKSQLVEKVLNLLSDRTPNAPMIDVTPTHKKG